MKRSSKDVEAEAPTEVTNGIDRGALPSLMGANTRRRIAAQISPAEIQTSRQIKGDKVENDAMSGVKIEEFGERSWLK